MNRVKILALSAAMLTSVSLFAKAPDYTSKIPQFDYPETLNEQEEALKTNPLMEKFGKQRQQLEKDRYFPIYHITAPDGKLNDPNGLCFWQGRWHLFHQAYPKGDPRQHWGHFVSDDLVNWSDLPYAIYPNPERACFSGGTWVEDDRVVAMYHGTEVGNMVATSDDPLLLNWEKTTTDGAAIPLLSESGFPLPYSVFDPCIWKEGDVYYSLGAGRQNNAPGERPLPVTYLFRSKDLVNWQYMHEFVEGDRFSLIGDDFACPYFLPIGDRYIMLHYSHMSGGKYLLGDYDKERHKFVVTAGGDFNFGASQPGGVHAPSAVSDGKGGVIAIFNMNHAYKTAGWNQNMSLARRLTLIGENEIGQEPAGDIESLRGKHTSVEAQTLPANKEVVFKSIKGDAMEINLEIDAQQSSVIELSMLRSPKKEEYTSFKFYKERGYWGGRDYYYGKIARVKGVNDDDPTTVPSSRPKVFNSVVSLSNAHSSLLPGFMARPPEVAQVGLKKNETLKLRIFIDKSVVEVFVNGKQCLAERVYPSRNDSVGFSIRSMGSPAELISLDAWEMKGIF